jgi:predicted nucleic acid-binding protein
MLILVDTGFLFALANTRDVNHARVLKVASDLSDTSLFR